MGKYEEARTRSSPWFFMPPTTEGAFSASLFMEAKAALQRQRRRSSSPDSRLCFHEIAQLMSA
ncbi:MAG: hypothetical protein ABFD16_30745, partial [Thermoguttaceae bacterium]